MLSNWLGRAPDGAASSQGTSSYTTALDIDAQSTSRKRKTKDNSASETRKKGNAPAKTNVEPVSETPKAVFASSSAVRLASIVFGGSEGEKKAPNAFEMLISPAAHVEVKIVDTNGFYVGDKESPDTSSESVTMETAGKLYTGKSTKASKRPLNTWVQTDEGKVFIDWKGVRHTGKDAFRMYMASRKGKVGKKGKEDGVASENDGEDSTQPAQGEKGDVICIDLDSDEETNSTLTGKAKVESAKKPSVPSKSSPLTMQRGKEAPNTKKSKPIAGQSSQKAKSSTAPSARQAVQLQQAATQLSNLPTDFFSGDQGFLI